MSLIVAAHGKFLRTAYLWEARRRIFPLFCCIRSQFRIASFLAWKVIGTNPSSKSTPSVLVCLLTPRSCLQNIIKNFSMGWFFGCFRQPQKSLQYSRIGLIRYVNICRVLDKLSLKWIPSAFFIFAYAFSARIRRSSNPVLISPWWCHYESQVFVFSYTCQRDVFVCEFVTLKESSSLVKNHALSFLCVDCEFIVSAVLIQHV